jgi:hypothetical protein
VETKGKAGHLRVDRLRELARTGELARVVNQADPALRAELTGAAYEIAAPVVFQHVTRGRERSRGHVACAVSMTRLADPCHDQFLDDVESVVDDVLRTTVAIDSLEGWIARRAMHAMVDGYRRRRGEVGALQRPRLPMWLNRELRGDPWLGALAVEILNWVGVPHTAGTSVWPVETWAAQRARITGDHEHSDSATVRRDIEHVLAAMRKRPRFFEKHVERPLGHKQPPVAGPLDAPHAEPLLLTDRAEADDAALVELAAKAIEVIEARVRRGDDVTEVVTDVLQVVFVGDPADSMDRKPLADQDHDERIAAMLGDEKALARIVTAVRNIVQ